MANIPETEQWKNFFEAWRELPELWMVRSDDYKNKLKKKAAFEKILAEFKKICPDANLGNVKQKLHNLRFCYRRELKKLEKSLWSGAGGEDVYVPNLWYFDELEFLREQEAQTEGISTLDVETTLAEEEQEEPRGTKRKSAVQHLAKQNEILRTALCHVTKDDAKVTDDIDIFGANWAAQFRQIPESMQQIIAKKAIEDILFLAKLNQLSLNTVQMPPSLNITSSTLR